MEFGARLFGFMLSAILAGPLWGCASVSSPPNCVVTGQTGGTPDQIRAAVAPFEPQRNNPLCEAVARLREKPDADVEDLLSSAIASAPSEMKWLPIGVLASVKGRKGDEADALRHWDMAIHGATQAHDRNQQHYLRFDRGVYFARREEFGSALADFAAARNAATTDVQKLRASYTIIGVAVSTDNLQLARKWYPTVLKDSDATNDMVTKSRTAQFLAQLHDEAGQEDKAEKLYDEAVSSAKRSGSNELYAEMLEYQGQSRSGAGDYRGMERAYSAAAQKAREVGQPEFADQLDGSLRQRLSAFETGNICERLWSAGKFVAAERSVADVPAAKRSRNARVCELQALKSRGDNAGVRQRLIALVEITGSGWPCDGLRAQAQELGMAVTPADPPPQLASRTPGFDLDPDGSKPPPHENRCRL